jgi:hypothetical protein
MVRWQFGTGKLSGVEGSGAGCRAGSSPAVSFANLTNSSKPMGVECSWARAAPRQFTRRHSNEIEPGQKVGHESPVLRDK